MCRLNKLVKLIMPCANLAHFFIPQNTVNTNIEDSVCMCIY